MHVHVYTLQHKAPLPFQSSLGFWAEQHACTHVHVYTLQHKAPLPFQSLQSSLGFWAEQRKCICALFCVSPDSTPTSGMITRFLAWLPQLTCSSSCARPVLSWGRRARAQTAASGRPRSSLAGGESKEEKDNEKVKST